MFRRAFIAGLLATPMAGTIAPLAASSSAPTSAELIMALDANFDCIKRHVADLENLLEDTAPTGELAGELGSLLEGGSLFVVDMESSAAGADDFTIGLKPSEAFLVLLAALRTGQCNLELVKNLNHGIVPSLDGFATSSRGGKGDCVKQSPSLSTGGV